MPRTAKAVKATEYIQDPTDACTEAASRINVVLDLLDDHLDVCRPTAADRAPEAKGGWELSIMREALIGVRNLLHRAARKAAQQEAEVR